jgi:hypothetical protein
VLDDPILASEMSWFDRGWLQRVYLAALLAEVWRGGVELAEAAERVREAELRELLDREAVRARLAALATDLWADSEPWTDWLGARVRDALGDAVLLACMTVAPRHAALDTLLLDHGAADGSEDDGTHTLWITQSTLGGAGVIESILTTVSADRAPQFGSLCPDWPAARIGLSTVVAIWTRTSAIPAGPGHGDRRWLSVRLRVDPGPARPARPGLP